MRPMPGRPIDVTSIPRRQAAGAILQEAASHADVLIVDSIAAASVAGRIEYLGSPIPRPRRISGRAAAPLPSVASCSTCVRTGR